MSSQRRTPTLAAHRRQQVQSRPIDWRGDAPKRLELSFRIVRALPSASNIGLDCSTACATPSRSPPPELLFDGTFLPNIAKYCIINLVVCNSAHRKHASTTLQNTAMRALRRGFSIHHKKTKGRREAGKCTSVFPAPLSPLTKMDWFLRGAPDSAPLIMAWYAASAVAYTCGGSPSRSRRSPKRRFSPSCWYAPIISSLYSDASRLKGLTAIKIGPEKMPTAPPRPVRTNPRNKTSSFGLNYTPVYVYI